MATINQSGIQETTIETDKRPRTHVDSQPLPTDSMVTVPLSESDGTPASDADAASVREHLSIDIDDQRLSSRPTSEEIMQAIREPGSEDNSPTTPSIPDFNSRTASLRGKEESLTPTHAERSRSGSVSSGHTQEVDWEGLEKDEERETREEGQDKAMALLLARLEQENNALAVDPKSGLKARARSQSRPPSMKQLKRLVEDDASQVRISQLPSPPPMTELEFWAALVRDYPQTVQRLPTLTLNKIRAGVPAPLRGVVWQSMAGARDKLIEDQYDTLCGGSTPYENIINKDIGRSFPGVEMFKDSDGEGQKSLGRVLKCFSLYDHKIGYCQGLGFLVGPLLMQMGDKEAFCVLVRLMEDYDLRSCFLPDLSGLHLRIFQFQQLLRQHMPKLAAHLESLQVESAYLSQWFLSFFAVTCPLPMLFRIYDVIFAEGASETLMRVALAVMKRNEEKILGFHEFEDVMQLLLGRALWDPYGRNAKSADLLVNDFVSFTNDVTREKLQGLEAKFKDAQKKEGAGRSGLFPEVHKSASSFLGRLWGPSNSSTKSLTLTPGPTTALSRPASFLRRTASKQSMATIGSVDGSSDGAFSTNTQSTALTDMSRSSSADALSLRTTHDSVTLPVPLGNTAKDKDLHFQIEQLLNAVSQMQKHQSELEAIIQKHQEERREDRRIVRNVIDRIRAKHPSLAQTGSTSTKESRRRTTITASTAPLADDGTESSASSVIVLSEPPITSVVPLSEIAEVIDILDKRFPMEPTHSRSSSMFETKESLRESLARTKEQLQSETLRAQSLSRDVAERDNEVQSLRETLRETRARLQESYNTSQRHERTIQELRARKPSLPWGIDSFSSSPSSDPTPSLTRSDTADSSASTTSTSGLREFKLGRSSSTSSRKLSSASPAMQFSKRTSSLATHPVLSTATEASAVPAPGTPPSASSSARDSRPLADSNAELLLKELVAAKTAEAVAKQEAEEMRARFEALRKAMRGESMGGSGSGGSTPIATPPIVTPPAAAAVRTPSTGSGGGFWGWGKK